MEHQNNKLGIIMTGTLIFVGKMVGYKEDGLIDMDDVAMFTITLVPMQQGGVGQMFIGNIIGKLIEHPESVTVLELDKNSPFYSEYFKLTAGISIVPPGTKIH